MSVGDHFGGHQGGGRYRNVVLVVKIEPVNDDDDDDDDDDDCHNYRNCDDRIVGMTLSFFSFGFRL